MEAFGSIEKTVGKTKIGATEKDHKLVGDILEVKQRLKRGNRLSITPVEPREGEYIMHLL